MIAFPIMTRRKPLRFRPPLQSSDQQEEREARITEIQQRIQRHQDQADHHQQQAEQHRREADRLIESAKQRQAEGPPSPFVVPIGGTARGTRWRMTNCHRSLDDPDCEQKITHS